MTMIKVKGYEFNAINIKDSFDRRALRFKNKIIETLRAIGLTDDDVEIDIVPIAMKNSPASASWWVDGMRLHYSYKAGTNYAENLYVVLKIIEFEVNEILEGRKDINQFIHDFTEEKDVEKERKEARKFLGVDEDSIDLDLINKQYKLLAKDAHPDRPEGSTEKFKALNRAHKILKRELE